VRPWRRAVILDEVVPVEEQRCIRVGVLGVPNAGKSQLTNTLVGSKVSAVSPKTNTTRIETMGAVTRGSAQLVLLDLPGIVAPEQYRSTTHATKAGPGVVPPVTCHTAFLFGATRAVLRGPGRNPGAS
jgi:GTP-binding protein Era